MRYDKELQAAGKFFVEAVQGPDGAKGRRAMKLLQDDPKWALSLRVQWRGGKFVAVVGSLSPTSPKMQDEWWSYDDEQKTLE